MYEYFNSNFLETVDLSLWYPSCSPDYYWILQIIRAYTTPSPSNVLSNLISRQTFYHCLTTVQSLERSIIREVSYRIVENAFRRSADRASLVKSLKVNVIQSGQSRWSQIHYSYLKDVVINGSNDDAARNGRSAALSYIKVYLWLMLFQYSLPNQFLNVFQLF